MYITKNIFQGDGESVPETPPNESSASSVTPSTTEMSNKNPFTIQINVDGLAFLLLVAGLATRMFCLDQPRNVV